MSKLHNFILLIFWGMLVNIEAETIKNHMDKIRNALKNDALEEASDSIIIGLIEYPEDEDLLEWKNEWYSAVQTKINKDLEKERMDLGTLYEDVRLCVRALVSNPTEYWNTIFWSMFEKVLNKAVELARQTEPTRKEFFITLTDYAKTITQDKIKNAILRAIQELQGLPPSLPPRPISAGVSATMKQLSARLMQLQQQVRMLRATLQAM